MLEQFLDALNVEQADLVGNDSGGGIAQIFSALYSQRVRSLTLTDCDVHDNWPPAAFKPFLAMAAGGGLRGTLEAMLSNKDIYRSPAGAWTRIRAPGTASPTRASKPTCGRSSATEQRTRDLQRFLAAFDNAHTRAVEAQTEDPAPHRR